MAESGDSVFTKHFPAIRDDGHINIDEFLQAASDIVPLFEKMKGFGPVINDVNGNIEKCRKRKANNPEKYIFFHTLLEDELGELSGKKAPDDYAVVGALWLNRGLKFIYLFLLKIVESDDEEKKGNLRDESLKGCINNAYDNTLKKHHNFIVSGIFKGVAHMAPKKSNLFEKITPQGSTEAKMLEEMRAYIPVLKANIDLMTTILVKLDLEEDPEKQQKS